MGVLGEEAGLEDEEDEGEEYSEENEFCAEVARGHEHGGLGVFEATMLRCYDALLVIASRVVMVVVQASRFNVVVCSHDFQQKHWALGKKDIR